MSNPRSTEQLSWWELIGHCDNADDVGAELMMAGCPGLQIVNEHELRSFYFGLQSEFDAFKLHAQSVGLKIVHATRIRANDWEAQASPRRESFRCGLFTVIPLWDVNQAAELIDPSENLEIFVGAGSGFGSGSHETTRAALELLSELKGRSFRKALDLGTGSAVLAIAAVKLLSVNITGTDLSDAIVEGAYRNAEANNVASFTKFERIDVHTLKGSFDLIMGNVYTEFFELYRKDIVRLLAAAGTLIISGLATDTHVALLERYRGDGLKIVRKIEDGRWTAALLERNS